MAGGDGSLAVVAAAAAANGLPFVCVPAGTRNHFAMDIGVDRHDVAGAVDAFSDGVERLVDLAEVNGRPFLNRRLSRRLRRGGQPSDYRDAKVRTLVETAERVLGPRGGTPALRLVDDAGREHSHSPWCWSRTTRTRWTSPSLTAGLRSTPAGWACSFSTRPAQGPRRGEPGPHQTFEVAASAPVHGGHRWRGGDIQRATASVHPSAAGTSRADLLPRHPGVSPSGTRGTASRPTTPPLTAMATRRRGRGMSRPVGRVLSPRASRRRGRRPSI